MPYFELRLDVPQRVRDLNDKLVDDSEYFPGKICEEIKIDFEYKYGDYDWNEGPTHYWNTTAYLVDFLETGYFEYYPLIVPQGMKNVDIKDEVYFI